MILEPVTQSYLCLVLSFDPEIKRKHDMVDLWENVGIENIKSK